MGEADGFGLIEVYNEDMEVYREIDEEKRSGWWKRNWRWLKVGVFLMVFIGALGWFGGWWRINIREETTLPAVPIGARVEVPQDLTGKKLVALTFDDGPSSETTPRLLDILKEKGVRATFFVLGSRAQGNADLVKREVNEGHEVESHSMYHDNYGKMAGAAVTADVNESRAVIGGITGVEVKLVRPPYGDVRGAVLGNLGVPAMLWSVDSLDWKSRDANAVREEVGSHVFDGAVVLMHDIYGSTVEAVGGIIDELRGQGYEFATIAEMSKARGVEMVAGRSYGSFRP